MDTQIGTPFAKQFMKELKGVGRAVFSQQRDEQGSRSQKKNERESKSKSHLGDEGRQGLGEVFCDPARKEDNLGKKSDSARAVERAPQRPYLENPY